MTARKKYILTKILIASVWVLLGAGTVVLLVAAITRRNSEHVRKVNINITGVQNNFFIDTSDVIAIIEKINGGKLQNKPLYKIDLAAMETALQKDQWVQKAEMFVDNNNVLQVKISEREPVVRIFTASGASFYMDSSLKRLPLSDKSFARLPVFTSFPTEVKVLTKKDSGLLKQIKLLGEFIGNDPFWMAQVEQVDINPDYTFELIPKVGNQLIHFGNADDYQQKFAKLLTFYKQVETKSGWNQYSAIDLKYKGQVIGVKRGAQEIKMDSLRSVQIMKTIISNAQKHTEDSTNVQLPAENDNSKINRTTVEKDPLSEDVQINNKQDASHITTSTSTENKHPETTEPKAGNLSNVSVSSPSFKKPGPAPLKTNIIKPAETKPPQNQKPKAVMPAKSTSDY